MGVNRGPSLALAILFDRGIEPLTAFDLLRSRRPQAFAIYATQYLRQVGRLAEAGSLDSVMEIECDHDDLVATIGRIRQFEAGGGYRFPLETAAEPPEPEPTDLESPNDGVCRCGAVSSDGVFMALVEMMIDYEGFHSTEWPLDWVRSLTRQLDEKREAAQSTRVRQTQLDELGDELDAWLEEMRDDED